MYIYQLIKEKYPEDTALLLYLLELAETDRSAFNSVAYAIKKDYIPLTLEAAQKQADKFRNRGAAPPKTERAPTKAERAPTEKEMEILERALAWAEKMGF